MSCSETLATANNGHGMAQAAVQVVHVDGMRLSLNYGQRAYCSSPCGIRVWRYGGTILTVENQRTRRKTCPSIDSYTTHPAWTDQGTKSALCGEWPRLTARAMPWLRPYHGRLPTVLVLGSCPGQSILGFVLDKVALEHVFLRVLWFSTVNIIPPWLHTHISSGG
jgi:hypothetical protein